MQVDEIERERIAAREAGGVASGRYSRSNLSAMEAPEFSTEPANEFHSGALKWGGGGVPQLLMCVPLPLCRQNNAVRQCSR